MRWKLFSATKNIRRAFHLYRPLRCGVLSYFYTSPSSNKNIDVDRKHLLEGLNTLRHRGPDGQPGFWIDDYNRVGLGHTRLAIIDLSDHGRQPLHSIDRQFHLSMNGELYDHDRIRREGIERDRYQFVSKSDSEIALYLYQKYGLSFTNHLRGEFAITLYDEYRDIFVAVRDRFGIKPLYYTYHDNKLILASEIKALFAFGVPAIWNEQIAYGFRFLETLATLYKNIYQLPPGHILTATSDGMVNISKYYDLRYATRVEEREDKRSEKEMIDGVRQHLTEAIRLRMRADVKVGVYLSGGLDSSAVLGIASSLSDRPIDSYSISFTDDPNFDEVHLCKTTVEMLGKNNVHSNIIEVTHKEIADNLDECIYHCEHPIRATSPVGKFLLSKLVNQNGGKVVLTGEGSDEIFSGYSYLRQDYLQYDYDHDPAIRASMTPEIRKQLLDDSKSGFISGLVKDESLDSDRDAIQCIGYAPVDFLWLSDSDLSNFSSRLRRKYGNFPINSLRYNQSDLYDYNLKRQMLNNEISRTHSSQYIAIKRILLSLILTALGDRTEMAHSVEARTPFLDHVFVDYVNQLPTTMKIKLINGKLIEKYILKRAAQPFITDEVYRREKHPFLAPPTFLQPSSHLHQYLLETFHSQTIKEMKFLLDPQQIQKNFTDLSKAYADDQLKISYTDRIRLEGHFLTLANYVTLQRLFKMKSE